MNIGADDGLMPAKLSDSVRAIGHGRVGEAGRRREPVGAADPDADGERHGVGAAGADAAVDDEQQPDGGDDLGEPQRARGAALVDHSTAGSSNMRLAMTAPRQPPAIWAAM